MPLLDEFTRKINTILPYWLAGQVSPSGDPMQGMIPGQAQLRTPGHPTAFVLPQDQYQSAVGAFGKGGEQAMTLRDPGVMDWLMSRMSGPTRSIYSAAQRGPAVILPQDYEHPTAEHEGIHAFLGAPNINPEKVNSMLTPEARASLARYYSPAEMAQEVPARTNEPQSMGMNTGSDVRRKYLDLLRGVDPSKATALAKYWGLSGSEKGDNAAVLQKPNDTF